MTRRRVARLVVLVVLAGGSLVFGADGAVSQGAPWEGCDQPYAPVATANIYGAMEELPPVDATVVSGPLVEDDRPFDSDNDGTNDTVAPQPGGGVRITRGDGVVVLVAPEESDSIAYGMGDIDGDGRDEFTVVVQFVGEWDVYLVPGTVPAGSTPVADAGILVGESPAVTTSLDDGSGRMVVSDDVRIASEPMTDVYDASDVLAIGPGGDVAALPPLVTAPGQAALLADLGDEVDALVTAIPVGSERLDAWVVRGAEVVALTTAPEYYLSEYTNPWGEFEVLDGPDGAFVTLTNLSRIGVQAWMWSLDDPCTSLQHLVVLPPTEPPAPPADPVDTEADFTG